MLGALINLFSGKVEIELSPERFLFKRKDVQKSFSTIIHVYSTGKRKKLVGIGDAYILQEPNLLIELFRSAETLESQPLMVEYLSAFFTTAFRIITNRKIFIPSIIFKNSNSLINILRGNQKEILEKAAKHAGAYECIFED